MGTPFSFGFPVEGQDFVGHSREVESLVSNMLEGRNSVLVAPRKYGKTSLVRRAVRIAGESDPSLLFCHVNIVNIHDEVSFCCLFAQEVIKAFAAGWEQAAEYLKVYFPEVESRLSVHGTSLKDVSIVFETKSLKDVEERFLSIAVKMAKDRGVRLVVCVDDFHNVVNFRDPVSFLKKFRRHLYGGGNVTMCLSWSRDFVMNELLASLPKASGNLGRMIRVGRMEDSECGSYLKERFATGTKYLDEELSSYICGLVEGHPFYIQLLAQEAWLRTCIVCTKEIVQEAYQAMTDKMSMMFQVLVEGLTPQQLCYLKALVCGETVISSADVLHRYGISSATSASRSKTALLQKDILVQEEGLLKVSDPLLSYWLSNRYFRK